jgi:Ser/Thr protein kinase RdoA (MazF antagonist)
MRNEPSDDISQLLTAVLAQYDVDVAALEPFGQGLINRTWRVTDTRGAQRILQAVNPIFPAAIHTDIAIVTARLRSAGLATPELLPSRAGTLSVTALGQTWRLLTYLEGITLETVDVAQARAAGALLGRFHRALGGLEHRFAHQRLGVHDTARHLAALREALEAHRTHSEYAAIAPLAADVLALAAALPPLPPLPDRIVHGDPKITNIVFDAQTSEALALIDLDTLAHMPLPLELGDAFRSWCNPAGEDAPDTEFSLPLFESALSGYAGVTRGWLTVAEGRAIPDATATIAVELAARFCADALAERYFSWDRARYASASRHHQARTRAQLQLARSIRVQHARLADLCAAAFS